MSYYLFWVVGIHSLFIILFIPCVYFKIYFEFIKYLIIKQKSTKVSDASWKKSVFMCMCVCLCAYVCHTLIFLYLCMWSLYTNITCNCIIVIYKYLCVIWWFLSSLQNSHRASKMHPPFYFNIIFFT